jgi:hypothetical protein
MITMVGWYSDGHESQHGCGADNVSQSRSGSQKQYGEDCNEPGQKSLQINQNPAYRSIPHQAKRIYS